MVSFAKIPDLVGYLVLTQHGAVLESDGDLKNDENCANVITSLINLAERYLFHLLIKRIQRYNCFLNVFLRFFCSVDEKSLLNSDCQRMSIVFENHSYTICLSNKKIYVAKRAIRNVNSQQTSPTAAAISVQPENKNPNVEHAAQQSSKVVHA